MTRRNLSLDDACEWLAYEPQTGLFRRRKTAGNCLAGSVAGNEQASGYIRIGVCGSQYWAHRLAWFMTHGTWPKYEIDHIDGDRSNNRISNIRDVTHPENLWNSSTCKSDGRRNRTGALGVEYDASCGMWRARIRAQGRRRSLGSFRNKADAAAAYQKAQSIRTTATASA